jgi:hypothetical protein
MLPWGKEGLLCVTASVNRLGGAAEVAKSLFWHLQYSQCLSKNKFLFVVILVIIYTFAE